MFKEVFRQASMLKDKVRMKLYQKAIREIVKKGDIVVDIGTGSAILAFFALQAGAKKVYAIERSVIIEEAKKIAQHNKWGKKIIFINKSSDRVVLPEKADVVISEIIGFLGVEENLGYFQIDARKRFLKRSGKLLPSWLKLYLVPVESKSIWDDCIACWSTNFYGCDFSVLKRDATSQRYAVQYCDRRSFLSKPSIFLHLNFYEIDTIPGTLRCNFIISKNGMMHGMLGFFKAGLSAYTILSTSPTEPLTHWKQAFFPLEDVIRVKQGDELDCRIRTVFHAGKLFWLWDTVLSRDGREIAKFSQNNLYLKKEEVALNQHNLKPRLTHNGNLERIILSLCNGRRTIEEISGVVKKTYPYNYKTIEEAKQAVISVICNKVN